MVYALIFAGQVLLFSVFLPYEKKLCAKHVLITHDITQQLEKQFFTLYSFFHVFLTEVDIQQNTVVGYRKIGMDFK